MDEHYNLGIIKHYEKNKIIIKPLLVNDNTGYEEFAVLLTKSKINFFKKCEENEEELLILPYDENKNLIGI